MRTWSTAVFFVCSAGLRCNQLLLQRDSLRFSWLTGEASRCSSFPPSLLSTLLPKFFPLLHQEHKQLHKESFLFPWWFRPLLSSKMEAARWWERPSGFQSILWDPSQLQEFLFVHAPLPSRSSCWPALWASGSSTRQQCKSCWPASTPGASAFLIQPWMLHPTRVPSGLFFVVHFALSPTLSLSKRCQILQEWFKSHPLHETFPDVYGKNEPLSPAFPRVPLVYLSFLFEHLMHPAFCGSSVHLCLPM